MKKNFALLTAVLITAAISAQVPDKMSYQAVIRNASDQLVTDQEVGLRVSILHNSIGGYVVYQEIYNPNPKTNNNGLLTIEVGAGVPVLGTFSEIDWSDGSYFLRTEADPSGGTTYTITGTSQILSVPYALHAKTAETLEGGLLWNSNENDIYFNSGRVGIGNNNPLSDLHVSGKAIIENNSKIHIGDNRIFFEDNGEITSYDEKHKILFRRDENLLEFREYGIIAFSAGATEGVSTNYMRIREDGHVELKNKNIRNVADPVNPQDAATKAYVDESLPTKYEIGDFAHGGIVFYIEPCETRGLVAAKEDQDGGSGVRWHAGTDTYTMALGDGPLAGKMNTAIIIANQGRGDGLTYAARICNELQITEGGKTYGDWYLPSKEELNLMYKNICPGNGNIGNFVSFFYWSSAEHLRNYAWGQSFYNGVQNIYFKFNNHFRVRAVRAF